MHMMLREYDALLSKPLSLSLRSREIPPKLAVEKLAVEKLVVEKLAVEKLAVGDKNTPLLNDVQGPSHSLSSSTLSVILTTIDSLSTQKDKGSDKHEDQGLDQHQDNGLKRVEDVFLFLNAVNANAFVNHRRCILSYIHIMFLDLHETRLNTIKVLRTDFTH